MSKPSDPDIPRVAELIGATDKPIVLGGPSTTVCFDLEEPRGPVVLRSADHEGLITRRAFLNFEKMLSEEGSPPVYVYLNIPPGKRALECPDRFAGELTMFGLLEASISDQFHKPLGFNAQLDITELFAAMAAAENWKLHTLCVTFVSRYPGSLAPVRISRVSLYLS